MKIKRFNEDTDYGYGYGYDNSFKIVTVGDLINALKKYDADKRVAINVAEEPSIVFDIQERKAEECYGRSGDLAALYDIDPDDDVILIRGNQY